MEIVYLGLLSSIFNWIFDKILSPIFSFVSSLLESVLGWLFNNVLSPLLQEVLWPIFTGLLDLIYSVLAGIFYTILASLLKIIDSLQQAFNLFAGIDKVIYKGEKYTLLEMVFHLNSVRSAFILLTVVGVFLAIMFAAIAVSQNIFDMETENTRPVSKILGMTLRTMVRFLIVPLTVLFLIRLSGGVLEGIQYAMGASDGSLARTVFVVSSLDAAKNEAYNISGSKADEVGIMDAVRKDFYIGEKHYYDKNEVGQSFKFEKFDYIIGFSASIFLIVVLALCLLNFVSRIFEVIVLYIVSPFFVSIMPLDDGEKFKAWQDMFVAKLFSGYGSVIGMELYMMLCPQIIGGQIKFGEGTAEANYLIKLIFLLGGAWSVIKCGPMITQLLNFQAGAAEREMGGFVAGTAVALGAGAYSRASGAVSSMYHKARGGQSGGMEGGQMLPGAAGGGTNASSGQKFSGSSQRPSVWGGSMSYSPRTKGGTGTAANGSRLREEAAQRAGSNGGAAIERTAGGSDHSETPSSQVHTAGQAGGSRLGEAAARNSGSNIGTAAGRTAGGSDHPEAPSNEAPSNEALSNEASSGQAASDQAFTDGQTDGNRLSEGTDQNGGGNDTAANDEAADDTSATERTADGSDHPEAPSSEASSDEASSDQAFTDGQADENRLGQGVVQSFGSKGRITIERNADGKDHLGIHFGKMLTIGQDAQGRFRVSILGIGTRTGKDGKIDKVYLPFVRRKRNSEGKFQVSKVKVGLGSRDSKLGNSILGGLRWKRTEAMVQQPDGSFKREMGKMYFSDISALGVKRRFDKDTGNVEKIQMGAAHYEKQNGEYQKAYSSFAGFRKDYGYRDDGSRYVKSRDWRPVGLRMEYQVNADKKHKLSGLYGSSGKNYYRRYNTADPNKQERAGGSADESNS